MSKEHSYSHLTVVQRDHHFSDSIAAIRIRSFCILNEISPAYFVQRDSICQLHLHHYIEWARQLKWLTLSCILRFLPRVFQWWVYWAIPTLNWRYKFKAIFITWITWYKAWKIVRQFEIPTMQMNHKIYSLSGSHLTSNFYFKSYKLTFSGIAFVRLNNQKFLDKAISIPKIAATRNYLWAQISCPICMHRNFLAKYSLKKILLLKMIVVFQCSFNTYLFAFSGVTALLLMYAAMGSILFVTLEGEEYMGKTEETAVAASKPRTDLVNADIRSR